MTCQPAKHKYLSNPDIIASLDTRAKLVQAQGKYSDKHVRICLVCNELDFTNKKPMNADKMMHSDDLVTK